MASYQSPSKPFPELIKKARKSNNLTQDTFGRLFDPPVTQSSVARWEKGEMLPDRRHFPKIASLLNLTLEELFEFIENQVAQTDSLPKLPALIIPNKRHLSILNRGAVDWNRWRKKNPEILPQLAGVEPIQQNLAGIDLSGVDLREAKLNEVDLSNSTLFGADLQGASLINSNLSNADLRRANFSKANLSSTYFNTTNLTGINFSEAILRNANFYQANLTEANLSHADLTYANLRNANLNHANLENAVLKNCLVYGVSVWDVKLKGAVQHKLNICPTNVTAVYVNDLRMAYIGYLEILHPENFEIKNAVSQFYIAIENLKKIFRDKFKSSIQHQSKEESDET